MIANNILGIIFAYTNGDRMQDITKNRVMASVPFGGRYRFIDFVLSNMVNSGINKVGVVTDYNYQSLMDHLGSGKAWDLSRKREGLYLLPPFGADHARTDGKIESLYSIKRFLQKSNAEYILLSDSDHIYNMNYRDLLAFHIEKNADVTGIYRTGDVVEGVRTNIIDVDETGRVVKYKVVEKADTNKNIGMHTYLLKKDFLIAIVDECMSTNVLDFDRGVLFKIIAQYNVYGYHFKGYCAQITSRESYYKANMDLVDYDIRNELFNAKQPIYTKVKDEMPAKYGLNASVKNSLIADGCVIDGEVENCVLFRGAVVGKGAKLKNCVLMQNSKVCDNSIMENVITDKNVIVGEGKELKGTTSYHNYISKDSIV